MIFIVGGMAILVAALGMGLIGFGYEYLTEPPRSWMGWILVMAGVGILIVDIGLAYAGFTAIVTRGVGS